ncbi:MAG: PAS domain S-box protein, partial [Desulfobacteraceae bacterium]|nr:PAS domain S-box protein [Desulfobacteraceae bacterium]
MREHQILDSINSGFLTLHPDLTVSFWNRWLEQSTSIKRDDIIDRNIFEFFPDLESPIFMRNIKSVLSFGTHSYFSQKIHGYLLKMDNPILGNDIFEHMQQNCSMGPLREDDNSINEVFIVINDVTDIATMEVKLRKTNTQLSSIIDDQTELICRFSPDGILTFVNDSFCRYISRPREAIVGTSAFVFIYKGDWRMMTKKLRSLSPASPIINVEFRIVLQETGEIRWQNWTGKGFFDTNGKMIECQAVGRDITRQKLADEELNRNKEALERKVDERAHELKKSEAMYRNLFNTSRDGLVIVGSDGTVKDANPKFLELTGYSNEDFKKIPYSQLIPGVGLSIQSEIIQAQVLQRGYSDIYEIELLGKEGMVFPASIRSYDTSSDDDLIMHNVRDITKRIADKKERTHILRELERKVKHFKSLYIVLASIKISNDMEETFNDTIDILKDSLQYPEIACVKISIGDLTCQSPDYKKTAWGIESKLTVEGTHQGHIEINYLKKP